MYRLTFLSGPLKGKRLAIQSGAILIGRDSGNQIVLEDDQVSPHHAVIDIRGGGPVIQMADESSVILMNDRPVKEHRLRGGDRIQIGSSVIEYQSAVAGPLPRQRRRFSKMQATAVLSIVLILLLQVVFVVVFPIWQKKETVPVPLPPPEAPPPAVTETPPPPVETPPVDVVAVPEMGPPAPEPSTPAVVETPTIVESPPPELVTPTPERPAVEDAPVFDPLLENARNLLGQARRQMTEGHLAQADNLLHRVQMLAPDYAPAWKERALLAERQGQITLAADQWEQYMQLVAGTADYDKARAARDRLLRTGGSPPDLREPTPVRATTASPRLARRIRILSVERERFQQADEYDELRLLRIALRPQAVEGAIASERVEVIVQFYDRVEGTTRVVPTRALTLTEGLRVSGPWPAGEARNVTASYALPRGFRAEELNKVGERRVYEGYRISLFYRGELQDESAMPRRLLDLGPAPKPTIR